MKNLLRALNPFIAYNNLQLEVVCGKFVYKFFYYGQPVKLNNQLD